MFLPLARGEPAIGDRTSPTGPAVESPRARSTDAESIAAPTPKLHRRFDRAARLVGEPGLHRLMGARVLVFGCGGVGSFAAEALARSGVGALLLVDFDRVCVTNTNRQLHAMKGNVGKSKVGVMAERLRLVNPIATIEAREEFYEAGTSDALLAGQVDFIVDAIDNMTAKAHLVATAHARSLPIVSSMGAAARLDPTAIAVADLTETTVDPFAAALRKILREKHGLAVERGSPLGIDAVYSTERPLAPLPLGYDAEDGFQCVCPQGENDKHSCERRSRIDGSAAFVTGAFGLTAASVVVRALARRDGTVGA